MHVVSRPAPPVHRPEGLVYQAEFVTEDEERDLVSVLEDIELVEVRMRGQVARRTVRHFGYDYDYESWSVTPTDPLPTPLSWLRERCASFADLRPEELAQALVTRYPAGAGIGWHRDSPIFGPKVVGVSLGAGCRMRFQRGTGATRCVYDLDLEPRSAYLLRGQARSAWQHSIPATKALRYSVTFRTLKSPARWVGAGGSAPRSGAPAG